MVGVPFARRREGAAADRHTLTRAAAPQPATDHALMTVRARLPAVRDRDQPPPGIFRKNFMLLEKLQSSQAVSLYMLESLAGVVMYLVQLIPYRRVENRELMMHFKGL